MTQGGRDAALQRIRAAYDRRSATYSMLDRWVYLVRQEKERAVIEWLREVRPAPLSDLRLVELGCGTGGNLLDFLRIGLSPENLVGVDLIESRVEAARRLLPGEVSLHCGDAAALAAEDGSFDVVYQSMMFSSILDDGLLVSVAQRMWRLAKPGGGVLWYDFTTGNPRNPDVRGLPVRRIRELFPASGTPRIRRVTLAPPLARAAARISPVLYPLLNSLPLLRTHVLCWLPKPAG